MEYEIEDDPQGDCDRCEADRAGGVREDHLLRRRCVTAHDMHKRAAAGEGVLGVARETAA